MQQAHLIQIFAVNQLGRCIGFKSVEGFAKIIHVVSGNMEITFSKEKTRSLIPNASRVPLIRIPHKLSESDKSSNKPYPEKDFFLNGFTTIFIFSALVAQQMASKFEMGRDQ